MMKQTRRQRGMHSVLSSHSVSQLETVLEDAASQSLQQNIDEYHKLQKSIDCYRKAQEDSEYWRKVRAKSLSYRRSRVPNALLHNDWYLNQLLSEVFSLYQPGSLTGFPIRFRTDTHDRHLSLLRDLAPGIRINPLFPTSARNTFSLSAEQLEILNRDNKRLAYLMPPKRKTGDSAESTRSKRAAVPRKDLYSDEQHLFSSRSKLIKEDVVSLFADPEAWSCLDEEEKDQIRAFLPPDIPYDETGAPDQSYLRYDNDWRNQLRIFQEDLAAGHYEPEWIAQAEAASEARRRGDYDAWKEDQFEQYWGQKSDAHADMMHGESFKIRLSEMISAGLFRVGDIFMYTRHFGRHGPRQPFLVEKDCILVELNGTSMTFTLSPGTRRKVKTKLKPLVSSPSAPLLKTETERRSVSDETGSARHRFPAPSQMVRPRSLSLESPSRRYSTDFIRPASSDCKSRPENEKDGTKRPGLLERLSSLSRRSSVDKSKGQESDMSKSGSFFKIKRKPPGPRMKIVNNPVEGDGADEAFSDSTLSELSDSDFQGPAPWLERSSKSPSLSPRRKPVPLMRRGSREQTPKTIESAKSTGGVSQKPEDLMRRRPLPRRPFPTEKHANKQQAEQAEKSVPSRRPSTRGSNPSNSASKASVPQTPRSLRARKKIPSPSTTNAALATKKQAPGSPSRKRRTQSKQHGDDTNEMNADTTQSHHTLGNFDAIESNTPALKASSNDNTSQVPFDATTAEEQGLIVVSCINSLHALEMKVLRVDGRQAGEPRADAWRAFHCRRGDQDLGSLSDMRDEYYKKKNRIL